MSMCIFKQAPLPLGSPRPTLTIDVSPSAKGACHSYKQLNNRQSEKPGPSYAIAGSWFSSLPVLQLLVRVTWKLWDGKAQGESFSRIFLLTQGENTLQAGL